MRGLVSLDACVRARCLRLKSGQCVVMRTRNVMRSGADLLQNLSIVCGSTCSYPCRHHLPLAPLLQPSINCELAQADLAMAVLEDKVRAEHVTFMTSAIDVIVAGEWCSSRRHARGLHLHFDSRP